MKVEIIWVRMDVSHSAASAGDDKTLRLWKRSPETKLYEPLVDIPNLHTRTIYSLSVNWPLIATSGGDNRIIITKFEQDADSKLVVVDRVEGAHDFFDVNGLEWCRIEGFKDHLASCGDDSRVKIWKFSEQLKL